MRSGDGARREAQPLPLAVTMGDPAGIGLDIIATAWAARAREPLPSFLVVGDPEALVERARLLGHDMALDVVDRLDDSGIVHPDRLTVLAVRGDHEVIAGKPDTANAKAVIGAIERAVAETVAGRAAGIVTCPIAKSIVYAAGFPHPGHTEFLGTLAELHFPGKSWQPVMMLAAEELKVVPVTVHIPIADVPTALTRRGIVDVCRIAARDVSRRFGLARPRLAVAGLNPHAGEGGSLGREEIDVIGPAIATLRQEGHDVSGPVSADTMFHAAARARYDIAICMYHDQALIPLKTLAFDTGVNVTLGLPFVRTSPDHGTAFDIAGSGQASATSLVAALRLAARMAWPVTPAASTQ